MSRRPGIHSNDNKQKISPREDNNESSGEISEEYSENEEGDLGNQSQNLAMSYESGYSPTNTSLNNTKLSSSYHSSRHSSFHEEVVVENKRVISSRSRTNSPNARQSPPMQYINHSYNNLESRNKKCTKTKTSGSKTGPSSIKVCVSIIFAVISSGLGLLYCTDSTNPITCDGFRYIKKDFPNQQDNLWESLKIGIESVVNRKPTKPSIYLLIHHESYQPNNLVNRIVKATLDCLGSNTDILTFESEVWQNKAVRDDHGVIVDKYIRGLKNGGVLSIPEVNKIPAEGARALHFICDNISPIHERVVIFLTLPVPEMEGKEVTIAENELNKIWGSTLKPNELDPLIARVTDQVLWLMPN